MTHRILVAEPSRTLATLIQLTLRGVAAELEFASDGREALALARERTPDLVIAEADLPGLDGYALVAGLRGMPGGGDVAVLLTASDHAAVDPERLAYLGIGDVLPKPFERAALLERVRALLEARDAPLPPPRPGGARRDAPLTLGPPRVGEPTPGARGRGDDRGDEARPSEVDALEAVVAAVVERELAAALEAAVERALPSLVEAAVERALPSLVEAAVARVVDASAERAIGAALPPLVANAVAGAVAGAVAPAVDAALPAALEGLAAQPLATAAERAVAKAMPELMEYAAFGLGPKVESVLRELLSKGLPEVAEKVVWKVVPEIAEDLIREEIRRLTEADGHEAD